MTRYHKSKITILKTVILTLLTMLIISAVPLTVHADGNGAYIDTDGNLVVSGTGSVADYDAAGPNKTGWLLYLVDASSINSSNPDYTLGEIVSDVVYVHCGSEIPHALIGFLYPRLNGDIPTGYYTNAPWGTPFKAEGGTHVSRQPEIEAFMEQKIPVGNSEIAMSAFMVATYLGEDAAMLFKEKPETTYLVLEPCAYHTTMAGPFEGRRMLASGYGWMLYQSLYTEHRSTNGSSYFTEYGQAVNSSLPEGADTSWCDNRELLKLCVLDEKWVGLPAVPVVGVNFNLDFFERVSNKEAIRGGASNLGLGMLAYRLDDGSSTSTYDETLTTNPGPAPNDTSKLTDEQKADSTKHANIVKFYQTTNLITNTSTMDSYTRKVTPKTIAIEAETATTGYTIKEWFTSSSLTNVSNGSPSYTACKNNISNIQSGTTEGTVKLGDTETTLYLLLVKETGSPQPTPPPTGSPDFVLQESELTKPIPTLGTKLTNPTITYQLNLLDPCKGHCGGHCSEGDVEHTGECVSCAATPGCTGTTTMYDRSMGGKCSVCGGQNWSACTDDSHEADPCSDEDVKKGNCSHTQTTCTNLSTCGTKYECTESLNDTTLNFARTNTYRLHPLIALTSNSFTDQVTPATHTRAHLTAHTVDKTYNYSFVLTRSSIDPATLCGYKTSTGNTLASELFTSSIKYPNTPTRHTNGVYTSTLTIQLDEDTTTQDKVTTAKASYDGKVTTCTATDTATIKPLDSTGTTITPVPKAEDQNVEIKVYKGVPTTPHTTVDNKLIKTFPTSGNDKTSGRQVQSPSTITFHPYIQMTIQSLSTPKQNNT